MLTNQLASFWRLRAFSMARAGSFCAVLLFLCACLLLFGIHLAASEFPVHITTTMWSIDDILRPPQTRVPNILPTPPPSPSVAASEFPVHITTTMWSIDDILRPPQTRAPNILPTPPPSPSVPPATFVHHTIRLLRTHTEPSLAAFQTAYTRTAKLS